MALWAAAGLSRWRGSAMGRFSRGGRPRRRRRGRTPAWRARGRPTRLNRAAAASGAGNERQQEARDAGRRRDQHGASPRRWRGPRHRRACSAASERGHEGDRGPTPIGTPAPIAMQTTPAPSRVPRRGTGCGQLHRLHPLERAPTRAACTDASGPGRSGPAPGGIRIADDRDRRGGSTSRVIPRFRRRGSGCERDQPRVLTTS